MITKIENTRDPRSDKDSVNKKFVDQKVRYNKTKTFPYFKNVFQYLMNDVHEWSTEYNVEVDKIDGYQNLPHYWDKN